jgi:hypothetical protein
MNYSVWYLLLLLAWLHTSCDGTPAEIDFAETIPDSTTNVDTLHIQTDTLVKDSLEILRDVSNWKPQDFIVDADIYSNQELWSSIDWQLEQVKGLKSPFVAKFTTVEIGDYFHLNFETEDPSTGSGQARVIDFGDGENNLGEYVLYSPPDFVENPMYAGKTFLVYWNWEIAAFQCCSGSYNIVKAYVPTITKLELMD